MKNKIGLLIILILLNACGTSKEHIITDSKTTHPTQEDTLTSTAVTTEISEQKEEIIERPHYNPSRTIHTKLIHTKLEVDFNWEASQLNGLATLTLSPQFYDTDSLILDAKAMEILSVKIAGKPLNYTYNDTEKIRIQLDKTYTREEQYDITIQYIAKPEEKEEAGSSAITSDKGLYFINPKGENKSQMPQIWTQGETESNSVWFPTFDSPNFKSTQEIYITVDNKYKTLSNGILISSVNNKNGTRTDYWKQDLPHAPYLFMLAVGEFSIVKDSYTKKDGTVIHVNYYVEPEWEAHAQAIFGKTPEMIQFFSELLGVEYPWSSYDQIVVREYVSGAMENTTASVFGDFVYKTKRELIDSDDQAIIAHELIHQWFGNLVTLESWANLPLNESFANYSQYLWDEYSKGKDEADYTAEKEKEGYLQSAKMNGHHDLIWYDYDYRDDMFDGHSYNKGGRILHSLRKYLGDEAFFKGLKLYLNTHAFKTVELANLRMAFEEISGEDLNWFFNQWFFSSHHPILTTTQEIEGNNVTIRIGQTQNLEEAPLYKLPMKIGVYAGGKRQTYQVVVDKNINSYTFSFEGDLENIIIDEDRAILGEFTHKKPREWYIHQYYNAPQYIDRKEALTYGARLRSPESNQMILDALNDKFWGIRSLAIARLNRLEEGRKGEVFEQLKKIALTDQNSTVRSIAINELAANYFKNIYEDGTRNILIHAMQNDSSYLVISSALNGLSHGSKADIEKMLVIAESLESEPSSSLKSKLISIYIDYDKASKIDFMSDALTDESISGYDIIGSLMNFSKYISTKSIETQDKYFYVFEQLSKSGSAYVNIILPAALMNLKRELENQISELKSQLNTAERNKEENKTILIQQKLNEAEKYKNRINVVISN